MNGIAQQDTDFLLKNSAFVLVDQQRRFCDPEYFDSDEKEKNRGTEETKNTALGNIGVMNKFRAASVPVLILYHQEKGLDWHKSAGGLYGFQPDSRDIRPVPKTTTSAFAGSNIADILHAREIETLFLAGFNTDSCVRETAFDALKAFFRVAVLSDCTAVGAHSKDPKAAKEIALNELSEKGATILTFSVVDAHLSVDA